MTAGMCPIDGTPLPPSATGRPPTYCSVGCRRTAEYELRRLDRRLGSLEVQRDTIQVRLDRYAVMPPQGTAVVATEGLALASVEAAIVRATDRLRELLAGGDGPREPNTADEAPP